MAPSWIRSGLVLAGSLLAVASAAPAAARVDGSSGYSKAQTYSGALRYVRVDLDCEVVEKDPDAAYLIFKYLVPGQKAGAVTGTLEVVETSGGVRVFVSLPRLPEYHERMLRDGLMKKLRDEYGSPPAPKKPAEKAQDRAEDKPVAPEAPAEQKPKQ